MVEDRDTMKTSPIPTVIILHGNGVTNVRQSNWYGHLYNQLQQNNIPCICETYPDPQLARRNIWIPHTRKLSKESDNIILVGHSSGAQATLRYTEQYKAKAAVLVAATYSDLGCSSERISGYYPQGDTNLYDFEAMKMNCKEWYQFHSNDDPFIPLREAEMIRDGLGLDDTYYMLPGRSHFFEPFTELLELILKISN